MGSSRHARYPMPLQAWLVHAVALARALDPLAPGRPGDEAASVWLTGRAQEIRVFVREVLRDCDEGWIDADRASAIIEVYLGDMHQSMRTWFGDDYVPACCCAPADATSENDTEGIDLTQEPATLEVRAPRAAMPSETSCSR
jgi:hypothetical protein